jgi:hypothetical protein
MKSILAFLPLLVSCAFGLDIDATTSDGKKVVLQDDGTWRYKDKPIEGLYLVEYEKPTFKANDGYGKEVSVDFALLDPNEKEIKKEVPIEKLRQLVMSSVIKCHHGRAKNPLSFIPRRVVFLRNEGKFVIRVTWLAKNAYGAESEEKTYFIFDKNLKLETEG